jgi:hypothetical protein
VEDGAMLRKVSTALAIGLVTIGEVGVAISATPHERPAATSQQVVAKKRIPQSRLVKRKPALPKATTSAIKGPSEGNPPTVGKAQVIPPATTRRSPAQNTPVRDGSSIRPQTVAQSAMNGEFKSRLIRNQPSSRQTQPLLEDAAKTLPAEAPPAVELPAERMPADDLPAEIPRYENLPGEPTELNEPEPDVKVEPLEEPSPQETEPFDLEKPTPPSTAESPPKPENLPAPRGTIYRLEPSSKLVPVAADELKPGVIYLHDDSQGKPVWSFVQSGGQFWHAFGPGTTQALVHFDLRMTEEEALNELRKIDPKLAFNVTNQGARVFLRLQPDNTWKLVRTNSVPSIFDLETNQRWEMQWNHYVPVTHNCGDRWAYRDGQYWATHCDDSMRPN